MFFMQTPSISTEAANDFLTRWSNQLNPQTHPNTSYMLNALNSSEQDLVTRYNRALTTIIDHPQAWAEVSSPEVVQAALKIAREPKKLFKSSSPSIQSDPSCIAVLFSRLSPQDVYVMYTCDEQFVFLRSNPEICLLAAEFCAVNKLPDLLIAMTTAVGGVPQQGVIKAAILKILSRLPEHEVYPTLFSEVSTSVKEDPEVIQSAARLCQPRHLPSLAKNVTDVQAVMIMLVR